MVPKAARQRHTEVRKMDHEQAPKEVPKLVQEGVPIEGLTTPRDV